MDRRMVEDEADEAQANLAELRGAMADARLAMQRMLRLAHGIRADHAMHIEDAAARIEQGLDSATIAEELIEHAMPDLDDRYPGRAAQ